MKSDLLQEAIGLVKDEYIEDAHGTQSVVNARKKTGRQQLMFWGRWAAVVCAALIVVVGVRKSGVIKDIPEYPFWQNGTESDSTEETSEETVEETQAPDETEEPTNETSGMTEEMPPETEDPINGESIIWAGELNDPRESGGSEAQGSLAREKGVKLSKKFEELLAEAKDTDRFAFVVSDMNEWSMWLNMGLRERLNAIGTEMFQVSQECSERLVEEYGISYTEARARMFSDPVFMETRSRLQSVLIQTYRFDIRARYLERGWMLDKLKEAGLTVLYTAENVTYQPYLFTYSGLAVMVGTKEQILSLLDLELSYLIKLHPAADDAADYSKKYPPSTLEYTGEEVFLAGDSKLTVELSEAYEQAAGAPLNVVIHVGFINVETKTWEKGNKDELDALIYKALGVTEKEYVALLYGPDSQYWMKRYAEERNRITNYGEYQDSVADKHLLEGELVEMVYYKREIRAVMTYERAMEISQHKEIGYIDREVNWANQ